MSIGRFSIGLRVSIPIENKKKNQKKKIPIERKRNKSVQPPYDPEEVGVFVENNCSESCDPT